MAKSKKNIKRIRETLTEMDARTVQAEKDLKKIRTFIANFKKIEKNLSELTAYYHSGEWSKDTELLAAEKPDAYHYCANQDAIWNASQDIYTEKIILLKLLANSI